MLQIKCYNLVLVSFIYGLCVADSMTDMGKEEGYDIELHHVTTEDNYILGFHRIPARKPGARTVFLMHGLLNSGADYLVFGPKYSLGYVMADAGYDVWLGSARGTQFSRNHKILDPDTSSEFWNYSFHEIGKYDLPAMIDYALNITNRKRLHYVGHSQGCTAFFVMLALRSEYNAKIASMHAMAPAVFLGDFSAINYNVVENYETIQAIAETFDFYELSRSNEIIKEHVAPIIQLTCRDRTVQQVICLNLGLLIYPTVLPLLTIKSSSNFFRNTPAGAALKQLAHYAQLVLSDKFQQYDYKFEKNQQLYDGRSTPPEYDISNITTDIYPMFGGSLDKITPEKGVRRMIKVLGKCVKKEYYIIEFNHVDFIYSRFANKKVYPLILQDIRKYKI